MPEHWYFIRVYECPICGRWEEERERRYGPKPERAEDRYEFLHDTVCVHSHFV